MKPNKFAQNFNFFKTMKFTIPTMIMMVFMSLYQMVDGVFVSNLVGELGLTALNIVYPFTSIIIAISIMLATGSSAIIALNMGQKKNRLAKENFSFIILVAIIISIIIVILGILFINKMIYFLGATPLIFQMCYDYLFIMILATPLAMLQMLFQTFFVTAGKPKHGLFLTVLGGILNIILDYFFISKLNLGIKGAAYATSIGYGIVALYGLYYFTFHRNGQLYFVRPMIRFDVLKNSCSNGMSEMINNLAVAITTYLFNIIGIIYLKEEGVAAISIILYAQFIMTSIFMGYSGGIAPVFSYKYGAKDHKQIQKIFKISIIFTVVVSIITFLLAFVVAKPIAMIFASHSPYVLSLAIEGFYIFSISFLFTGINIFTSALFTAFSNGKISGFLSLLRTFVFLVISLITLPLIIGKNGIWLAVPVAEGLAVIFSIITLFKNRYFYHFF